MKIVVKLEKLEVPALELQVEGVHFEVEVDAEYVKTYQACLIGLMEYLPEFKELLSLAVGQIKQAIQQ